MKINRTLLLLTTLITLPIHPESTFKPGSKAYVRVPVAGCHLQPLSDFFKAVSQQNYDNVTHSNVGNTSSGTFTRINQLPYNTYAEVVEEHGDEVRIKTYLAYMAKNAIQSECWVHKNHIWNTSLTEDHPNNDPFHTNQEIVMLTKPTTPNTSTIIYPAGTRFLTTGTTNFFNPSTGKKELGYKIIGAIPCQYPTTWNPFKHLWRNVLKQFKPNSEHIIPATNCVKEKTAPTSEILRNNVITNLKHLINNTEGVVPFSWGGGAFLEYVNPELFTKTQSEPNKDGITYPAWDHANRQKDTVAAGFDAPHFITYILNISGKPANSANTPHLLQALPAIKSNEEIKSGDIVAYVGGAAFLEVHPDKTITVYVAAGYDYGYRGITSGPIQEFYQGIHTIDDLQKALHEKLPLQFLQKDGTPTASKIKEFKILSIA